MIWSKSPPGRSVRPMLPAKSVSPATSSLSGAKWRQTEPWVWPGVCKHLGGIVLEAHDCRPSVRLSSGGATSGRPMPSHAAWAVHHFEQRQVVFVEEDGRAGEALELERAADVVDVGVGDENLLELEAEFGEAAVNAATSSPGSMTMASWASSSPRMVQLQASGPTGKDSRIMVRL